MKSRRIRGAGHVACMGREEVYTGILLENLRERDHLEDAGVNGTVILKWILDWISLVQNRGRWLVLADKVMNLRVPKNAGNFLTT
jgi:hypothetical protein